MSDVVRDARAGRRCSTSSTSTPTSSAASSPTPCGSGSTAARSPRRRWSPPYALGRPGLPRALAALLLPAARRLQGADHLRRRADPRRHARSPPGGCWRASTAGRSTTRPLNFQRPEEGFEHQDAMPEVGAPDDGLEPGRPDARSAAPRSDGLGKEWAALDVRWLGNSRHGLEPDPTHPSRAQIWIRIDGTLVRRPARAPGRLHLRQRRDPARRRAGRARGRPDQRSRWRRSTTRSGSTGRSAPTSGGSTTSGRRRPAAPAACRSAGSSPGRHAGRDGGPGGPDPQPRPTPR